MWFESYVSFISLVRKCRLRDKYIIYIPIPHIVWLSYLESKKKGSNTVETFQDLLRITIRQWDRQTLDYLLYILH